MRIIVQNVRNQTQADAAVGIARSKGLVAFSVPRGKGEGVQVRIYQGLGKNPTAATTARLFGMSSLVEMSGLCGKSVGTLKNWFKDEPQVFFAMLTGVVDMKERAKGRKK